METAKPYIDAATQRVPPQVYEQWGRANGILQESITIFDERVWSPVKTKSHKFASEYPFIAMFVAVFGVLAFWPIVLYLGFIAFVLISCLCVAGAFAFGTVMFSAVVAGSALLLTLFITLLISIAISVSLIGAFLFLRFILHLRSQPTLGDGVKGWAHETKGRFISSVPIKKEPSNGSDGHEKVTTQ